MNISRMNKGSWGKIVAFFDIESKEGFIIKGFKLIQGENGYFVGSPSKKEGEENKYQDQVIMNKNLYAKVMELSINEYNAGNKHPAPQSLY